MPKGYSWKQKLPKYVIVSLHTLASGTAADARARRPLCLLQTCASVQHVGRHTFERTLSLVGHSIISSLYSFFRPRSYVRKRLAYFSGSPAFFIAKKHLWGAYLVRVPSRKAQKMAQRVPNSHCATGLLFIM